MNKRFFLITILTFSIHLYSQDTLYVNCKNEIVSRVNAKYYNIIQKDSLNPERVFVKKHLNDGTLYQKSTYDKYYSKKKNRIRFEIYYKSGIKRLERFSTKERKKNYVLITYWENGNKKRKDIFKKGYMKGKHIEGQCWNKKGEPVTYYDFEIKSRFPGGKRNALNSYLKKEILKNKIPKSVYGSRIVIRFCIHPDGSVSDTKLVSGTDAPLVNYWVIKAFNEMPKWAPASQDGQPIKTCSTISILMPRTNEK